MMKLTNIKTLGCDISYHQGKIDFKKMKQSGIRFIIIRMGYGTTVDKAAIENIKGAISNGFDIGVYWFIYADSIQRSIENAKKFIEVIIPYRKYINCGVYADWEYDSDKKNGNIFNVQQRSDVVDAFCKVLLENKFEAGIYANPDYIKSKFTKELITKYPLWYARYSNSMDKYANMGKNNKPYIWQYTSKASGANYGVSSDNIDLDYGYIVLDSKRLTNPYPKPERLIKYTPGKPLMHGDDIKWLQYELNESGCRGANGKPLTIDGKFGPNSHFALGVFQTTYSSFLRVDYICGPKTIQKLIEVQ